ncbi:MAG: hypothetical protein ACSHYF_16410 [Verrucomicrobiaceae bacterium]
MRETQMEMPASSAGISEDFEGKLEDAQAQLEYLHQQREQLERQKIALEELNQRKQEFLNGQVDLSEKLSAAITTIDRELFESKQEMEDMEQARTSFAKHLQRIDAINPQSWSKEELKNELENALTIIDRAEDEYDQAVAHFADGRRGQGIFGPGSSRSPRAGAQGDMKTMMVNGFAFNLPIIILGSLALLLYLVK